MHQIFSSGSIVELHRPVFLAAGTEFDLYLHEAAK